jgi:hypothetical protein
MPEDICVDDRVFQPTLIAKPHSYKRRHEVTEEHSNTENLRAATETNPESSPFTVLRRP